MSEAAEAVKLPSHHLLIVDDDASIVAAFAKLAQQMGCSCSVASNSHEAMEILDAGHVDVAVIDLNLPGMSGLELLEHIRNNQHDTEVIIITGQATIQSAVRALKMGAYDYLTKPFDDIERVERTIGKALEKADLVHRLRSYEVWGEEQDSYHGLIGRSLAIRKVFQLIDNISHSTSNVLILGESGTGKELVARAIWESSPRAKQKFVVVNCAAIVETLLESELFGHMKGSFTGAIRDKKGLFQEADGGTIFLDEIGDLPPPMQVKILRALQNGEVRPIGASREVHVDVRVIAATNRDLYQSMRENKFREDLFYRLNVIGIRLPALRERREDISLLAYHFMKKYAQQNNKTVQGIAVDAMQSLRDYRWVGNVRELENVIERAVVLATGENIVARELPPGILREVFYQGEKQEGGSELVNLPYREAKEEVMLQFNRKYIGALLQQSQGNISLASQRAGMDRNNFKKIIKKFGIDAKTYKKSRQRKA